MSLRIPLASSLLSLICFTSGGVTADELELGCGRGVMPSASLGAPGERRYAPSREIDILHLALDVTPDFQQRRITATATLRFKPIAKPLAELKLDAVDLKISEVTSTERIQRWQTTDERLLVTFAGPIPADRETSVTIHYDAAPREGLYFRTPEMGYKPEDTHLWTQGEAIHSRWWFPCFDAPNEKFTSEVICRVPEGMTVLSNGRLLSQEKDTNGLLAVRWLQDKPHVTYLISLVAGYFKAVQDTYRDVPLAFYVPATDIEYAARSFRDTKDMMKFFEQEIGVPYPWAKYYQVCVRDFVVGGMENTSLTSLTDRTLHTPEFETLRDSQGLVAHELAHQWFGDLVTCKDWAHVWLNEGFATYYEHLYDGYKHGRETLLYRLHQTAKHILAQPNQTNAIVRRDFNDPNEQFGYQAYPKGAFVLHMLRSQLGEELFRRCIQTFLERHAYGVAETEDLARVLEELSGRSWDQFFDQYVYHAAQPELTVNYSWDERSKLAKLSITQAQRLSDAVLLFNVPLPVRFKGQFGTVERTLTVKAKEEDFFVPLSEAPTGVRIDPELTLLAKVTFNPPAAMLDAQLADNGDMLGRLIAVEKLAEKKERGSVRKLREVLNKDAFYGVRIAASRALRAVGTDEAFEALRESVEQEDARARQQVVSDVAGFYRSAAFETALKVAEHEKNPEILGRALQSLAGYARPEAREVWLKYLRADSFRNVLGDAAIAALRTQDDPSYVEPLREWLREQEARFTTEGFCRALDTLAWLARHEEKKTVVREFLTGFLNSKKDRVRRAAIGALGTLGDAQAIAVLEKFTGGTRETPEARVAEKAIADLRAGRKPSAELGQMRTEMLDLQKQNRELRKELDELKKRLDAAATPATDQNKPSKKATAGAR